MKHVAIALFVGFAGGCQPDETAKAQAVVDELAVAAAKFAEDNAEATDKAAKAAKESSQAASEWAADVKKGSGELSATASTWIDEAAAKASESEAAASSIESILAHGHQVAPTALEIGRSLSSAVDRETVFEPIYQPIYQPIGQPIGEPLGEGIGESGDEGAGAQSTEKADQAIAAMPRVEVIDGLTIGFKDLTSTTAKERIKESGYLVIWRTDDHLIGFVYRSRQTVDIDKLVADAPRLIALVRAAL